MMKQTLCQLFVLALIAQIAAIPTEKAEAEARAGADKDAAEGKKKAGDTTAEAEHKAHDAKAAGEHDVDAADAVADAGDKSKNDAHTHTPPHHPAKDCHKPQQAGPLTAAVDNVKNYEKKLADVEAIIAKDFLRFFG